eukprot:3409943-Rhodomonas_salina.1
MTVHFDRDLKLRGGKLAREDFLFWKAVLHLGLNCSEWCGAPVGVRLRSDETVNPQVLEAFPNLHHLELKGGSACDKNLAAVTCIRSLTSISLFCGRQSMSAADLASA